MVLVELYGVGNATISDYKKNSDAITNYASALDNEDGKSDENGRKQGFRRCGLHMVYVVT
ncbi:hypothetical protein LAZ67_2003658 [Cordylochernes scorpioides]|uniref:Uncharacterized protein n=1 Tax=Cordylochernes scorpioides TaxID=51811 RepID=A0ABY6K6H3_9ARAC|nr:hypothetical protein LAZ67_2003658 [Cordylochernes scorpioides]